MPHTRRPRTHHRVSPYPGDHRGKGNQTAHDQMSLLIAAVSVVSVACSTPTVQQQRKLCRGFVDVSATRRGSLPHDEAPRIDRPGISATGTRRSEMYSGVCPKSDLWTSKCNLYWILSATRNDFFTAGLRSRMVRAAAYRTR